MLRRISTKLVLAVLSAVVLPFVAFAFYMNERLADRLTRHVVQQALMGLAKDLAGQVDSFVGERHDDLEQWANTPLTQRAFDEYYFERALRERGYPGGEASGPPVRWNAATLSAWSLGELQAADIDLQRRARIQLTKEYDRYLELRGVYDLLLLVADDGSLITCSSAHREGGVLSPEFLEFLFSQDFGEEPWFQVALTGEKVRVHHHRSPYAIDVTHPDRAFEYQVGFAAPVEDALGGEEVRGVLFALCNWKFIQDITASEVITDAFRGLVPEDRDPTPYAWIWDEDADTILGHPKRELYYQHVSTEVGLPQLTDAVLSDDDGWGLFPEYRFGGEDKNAAFKRTVGANEGGFGWVVGVGIDNKDIYATADELRALLLGGTSGVLVLAVVLTLFIARRTTGPIAELQRTVRKVAEGDLDARIELRSKDELGALAEDVNRMTHELKEQRARIVKAEKDAAWREMARQIAHDIKNPLTPISLSLDLLERVRREHPEDSEEILVRTMELIRRQVDHLREIAGDFYEFTGGRRVELVNVELSDLVREVLHLHDAWAVELGVTVQYEGEEAFVMADLGKLRRVLVNLVSNSLQAMPEGGSLWVDTARDGDRVRVSIRDDGVGVAPEAREHLFEPYFTTKSEGTGLGLAISKRVLEEMDGTIALDPGPGDVGTVATVWLPAGESPPTSRGDA